MGRGRGRERLERIPSPTNAGTLIEHAQRMCMQYKCQSLLRHPAQASLSSDLTLALAHFHFLKFFSSLIDSLGFNPHPCVPGPIPLSRTQEPWKSLQVLSGLQYTPNSIPEAAALITMKSLMNSKQVSRLGMEKGVS